MSGIFPSQVFSLSKVKETRSPSSTKDDQGSFITKSLTATTHSRPSVPTRTRGGKAVQGSPSPPNKSSPEYVCVSRQEKGEDRLIRSDVQSTHQGGSAVKGSPSRSIDATQTEFVSLRASQGNLDSNETACLHKGLVFSSHSIGKTDPSPKSPVSLSCHMYNLTSRLEMDS